MTPKYYNITRQNKGEAFSLSVKSFSPSEDKQPLSTQTTSLPSLTQAAALPVRLSPLNLHITVYLQDFGCF